MLFCVEMTVDPFAQAKHVAGENEWGVNGDTGKIVSMKEYGLYEVRFTDLRLIGPTVDAGTVYGGQGANGQDGHRSRLPHPASGAHALSAVLPALTPTQDDIVSARRIGGDSGGGGGGGGGAAQAMGAEEMPEGMEQ